MWRVGCVDEAHVRFGRRAEETDRSKDRHRASVRPHFKQDFAVHGAVLGIDIEVVERSDSLPGFVPVKKRWLVEQAFGTLMLQRRLVREYEIKPESSVSRTLWASMVTMARRLTGTSTPTWRPR